MPSLVGKQFGAYQITEALGSGGMATVYRAHQEKMGRDVVLKILSQNHADDPVFMQRFEQEARVLARLQHPHIVPVHDFGQIDDIPYIAMAFIDHGDLADVLRERRLKLYEIGQMMEQIGDALDYAHGQGVVHRDVKPANILIDHRGNCLLTDFGIAKIITASAKPITVTGVIGTPSYMSPEQSTGEPLDGRSDVYSLGIILYEMITGQVPYKGDTPMAVMMMHLNQPLTPPRELVPTLPAPIEQVIYQALAKRRDERYATVREMTQDLRLALSKVQTEELSQVDVTQANLTQATPSSQRPLKLETVVEKSQSPEQQRRAIPLWGIIIGIVLAVALATAAFGAGVFFGEEGPGPFGLFEPPEPPIEAFEACDDLEEDDMCLTPSDEDGSCTEYEEGELFCRPGPP